MSLDKEKYIALFIEESRENLLSLNDYLLELERGAGDLRLLNDIFRVAHTLKGMASTMSFNAIASLTHEMENLLDMLRNAQIVVSPEIIDILFSCLDTLETLIESISENIPESDTSDLVNKIKKILKGGEIQTKLEDKVKIETPLLIDLDEADLEIDYSADEKELILEALNNGYFSSEIKIFLMKDCVMKFLRISLVLQAIESKSKIIKTLPSREALLSENVDSSFVVTIIHSLPIETIINSILSIAEISSAKSNDLLEKFQSEVNIKKEKIIPELSNKIIPNYSDNHKNILKEALDNKLNIYEIYISLDKETVMKAIRVSMIMNTLDYLGCQVITTFPSNNELLNTNNYDNFVITVIYEKEADSISHAISGIAEIKEIEVLALTDEYFKEKNEVSNNKNIALPEFTDYEKVLIFQAKTTDKRTILLSINLMEGTVMKFARFIMVTKKLEGLGDIIKTIPSQEEIENENFGDSFQIVFITNQSDIEIIKAISSVAEIKNITDLFSIDTSEKSTDLKVSKQTQTYYGKNIPIEEKKDEEKEVYVPIKKEVDNKHEKTVAEKNEPTQLNNIEKTVNDKNKDDNIKKDLKEDEDKKQRKTIVKKQTIRVDTDRLDQLINMVEELVITRSRLNKLAANSDNQEINQAIRNLNLISSNLQNSAMKLRMMPVEAIFSRFPRMIRDVAKSLNKEIVFNVEGEDTEIDRTIIDELGDPLVHLLRNSADHGIESTEKRLENGKNKVGKINLIAKHEGNSVLIIVEDDGGGINSDKVKQKAVEKGVISQEEASFMSEEDAFQIIFLPGFSTVDSTTELSGRGVGMDAVLSKVKSLGGSIIIHSKRGEGTRFTIKLPLTLAIMEVLLVKLAEEYYAIPLSYIEEVKEIYPSEIKHINKVKVTIIRDKTIPLVDLKAVLNVPEKTKELDLDFSNEEYIEELMPMVIVRTEEGNKTSGFIVDSIIGQDDVVIKPLSKILFDKYNYISGTANLGDGNLALILNVTNLT
ncbi:MAG: chemotaxis protein CheW [Candidatus Sericytochromatia bacterium]